MHNKGTLSALPGTHNHGACATTSKQTNTLLRNDDVRKINDISGTVSCAKRGVCTGKVLTLRMQRPSTHVRRDARIGGSDKRRAHELTTQGEPQRTRAVTTSRA